MKAVLYPGPGADGGMANLFLAPQVEKLREAGVGLSACETLRRVVANLLELPDFRDTRTLE